MKREKDWERRGRLARESIRALIEQRRRENERAIAELDKKRPQRHPDFPSGRDYTRRVPD